MHVSPLSHKIEACQIFVKNFSARNKQIFEFGLVQPGPMTEFELILTTAGVFELPLPKVSKMMIRPKQRHSLGKYWKQRWPCQYLMHHGGRKAIKSREVVNVNMAKKQKNSTE